MSNNSKKYVYEIWFDTDIVTKIIQVYNCIKKYLLVVVSLMIIDT